MVIGCVLCGHPTKAWFLSCHMQMFLHKKLFVNIDQQLSMIFSQASLVLHQPSYARIDWGATAPTSIVFIQEMVSDKYWWSWRKEMFLFPCLLLSNFHWSGLLLSKIKDKFFQCLPLSSDVFHCNCVTQQCFCFTKKGFAKFLSDANDIDTTVITCEFKANLLIRLFKAFQFTQKVAGHKRNCKQNKNLPKPW